jgi:electron transfer flavoprotein beta subunit
MKIYTFVKMVPDLVEELEIAEDNKSLDMTWLRMTINEFDHHAVEQSILLKEATGADVTVIAPDSDDVDDVLYTAAALGADHLIKLTGLEEHPLNQTLAQACMTFLADHQPDLILTGVQAHDDLDGQFGALLAGNLDIPYIGYVSKVRIENHKAVLNKEYPGGLIARMETELPAVLGIQAAEQPPRYVAFSRIRQAQNTSTIDEVEVSIEEQKSPDILSMYLPESADRAEMIDGDLPEQASRMLKLLREINVIQ